MPAHRTGRAFLPGGRVLRDGTLVWRVGHIARPLAIYLPDPRTGRFDDPRKQYRTLYCSRHQRTALRETLQQFRRSTTTISLLKGHLNAASWPHRRFPKTGVPITCSPLAGSISPPRPPSLITKTPAWFADSSRASLSTSLPAISQVSTSPTCAPRTAPSHSSLAGCSTTKAMRASSSNLDCPQVVPAWPSSKAVHGSNRPGLHVRSPHLCRSCVLFAKSSGCVSHFRVRAKCRHYRHHRHHRAPVPSPRRASKY